jgi:hypothetical protein
MCVHLPVRQEGGEQRGNAVRGEVSHHLTEKRAPRSRSPWKLYNESKESRGSKN